MGNHRRFVIGSDTVVGETVVITGDTAKQIVKVLRMKEGDTVCLLDGSGCEYDAVLASITRDSVTARIVGSRRCLNDPTISLTLAICLPKNDKLELIVQKATELGISELLIVDSKRTVARPDAAKIEGKIARWRRIASEAAEQCGRARVPQLEGVLTFDEVMARARDYELALVAWEEERQTHLKDILRKSAGAKSALLVIGPEGGLTETEAASARAAGAECVSLGRRILRCETAAVAATAVVMYELEGEL